MATRKADLVLTNNIYTSRKPGTRAEYADHHWALTHVGEPTRLIYVCLDFYATSGMAIEAGKAYAEQDGYEIVNIVK